MAQTSYEAVEMAQKQFTAVITQMHAVALAITEPFAAGTFSGLHPGPVTIETETVLPDIDEVIAEDIALAAAVPYARTGGNRPVGKDRSHRKPCLTGI